MKTPASTDPFEILGLPREASEADIRARYLELVKQFPPEQAPDKFREVRAAFEAAKDPLLIAKRLLEPLPEDAPSWGDAIEEQQQTPPKLTLPFLLSLGNRNQEHTSEIPAEGDPTSR